VAHKAASAASEAVTK